VPHARIACQHIKVVFHRLLAEPGDQRLGGRLLARQAPPLPAERRQLLAQRWVLDLQAIGGEGRQGLAGGSAATSGGQLTERWQGLQ